MHTSSLPPSAHLRLDRARQAAHAGRARLLLCGFAGGSVTSLLSLAAGFGPDLEVWGLEYPGRGMRWQQPLQRALEPLLDTLCDSLDALDDLPLVLVGYSMGAQLAHRLALRRPAAVSALVVLSARAPHSGEVEWHRDALDDADLIARVQALGGVPEQVLGNAALMDSFLPVMRADLAICDQLADSGADAARRPLFCPLLALQGREDRLLARHPMSEWLHIAQCQREAAGVRAYPGGHFFHRGQEAAVAADIEAWLLAGPLPSLAGAEAASASVSPCPLAPVSP